MLRGKGAPAAELEPEPHGGRASLNINGGPPTMPAREGQRQIVSPFFIADDGTISYQLMSRKNGRSAGRIDVNKPLTTPSEQWGAGRVAGHRSHLAQGNDDTEGEPITPFGPGSELRGHKSQPSSVTILD
jgi:hypothetical protein